MKNKLLKRTNGGFSLVELIVVIAIMAILVGVAVPVYSSYIEKTQKTKDEQMIDEIKHAIEIAAVGNSWYQQIPGGGVVGTVVISDDGTTVSGDEANAKLIKDALEATFGDLASLKLSYDGWTGTLSAAASVSNSSFRGQTADLLKDVQKLTNSVKNLSSGMLDGTGFDSWLSGYEGKIDKNDPQQMANAAALYVASTTQGKDFNAGAFVDTWVTGTDDGGVNSAQLGTLGALAMDYAKMEAQVSYSAPYCECEGETLRDVWQKNNIEVTSATAAEAKDEVLEQFSKMQFSVIQHFNSGSVCQAQSYYDGYENNTEQKTSDANAYLAVMRQLSASESVIVSGIANENLYTSEGVVTLVDTYMLAATASGVEDGDVVIVVQIEADGTLEIAVYPLDF